LLAMGDLLVIYACLVAGRMMDYFLAARPLRQAAPLWQELGDVFGLVVTLAILDAVLVFLTNFSRLWWGTSWALAALLVPLARLNCSDNAAPVPSQGSRPPLACEAIAVLGEGRRVHARSSIPRSVSRRNRSQTRAAPSCVRTSPSPPVGPVHCISVPLHDQPPPAIHVHRGLATGFSSSVRKPCRGSGTPRLSIWIIAYSLSNRNVASAVVCYRRL
jgi:hypothetical protein